MHVHESAQNSLIIAYLPARVLSTAPRLCFRTSSRTCPEILEAPSLAENLDWVSTV